MSRTIKSDLGIRNKSYKSLYLWKCRIRSLGTHIARCMKTRRNQYDVTWNPNFWARFTRLLAPGYDLTSEKSEGICMYKMWKIKSMKWIKRWYWNTTPWQIIETVNNKKKYSLKWIKTIMLKYSAWNELKY